VASEDIMEAQPTKTVTTEAMTTREMAEVKSMVFMAKQFPRDERAAMARILKACEREALAEQGAYEYPRGDTKVNGPSIRMAEALAQNWGNITFDIVELEQRGGESTVMARAWDLETNVQQRKIFTVPHIRHTRSGDYKLTDPRDIYEMVANQGARRLRACILGVIPGDVVDAAVNKCDETLLKLIGGNLEEAIEKMIAAFKKDHGVTPQMIEKTLGCRQSAFTAKDVVKMRRIYTSIRDGMGKASDYFEGLPAEKPAQKASGNTKLDGELKLQGGKKAEAKDATAQ
jgi:hypothetical protein